MKTLRILGEEIKIKLSPSFIQNAACPFYLREHYVNRSQDRYIRVAALRGKAAHEAIAEIVGFCHEEHLEVEDVDDAQVSGAVQMHLSPYIMSDAGLVLSWVKLWRDRYKLSKHMYGWEERIALDDEYDECAWDDASYRGILDMIDIRGTHCTVTDWKSQPHIVSQTELDQALGNDIGEQISFYCWLASKLYPHTEVYEGRIWYLRYGFYQTTKRTKEDLELFEQSLIIKENKIAEIDSWDPVPGKHCGYCDYIHRCPLAQDTGPENREIISQQQALQAAQKITVMEAATKELKEKLKVYVSHNDDVLVSDKWAYGYHHSTTTKWPADKVRDVLADFHYDVANYVNVDARRMKKLLKEAAKENPLLEGALLDVVEEKHQTRFVGYNPDLGDDDEVEVD